MSRWSLPALVVTLGLAQPATAQQIERRGGELIGIPLGEADGVRPGMRGKACRSETDGNRTMDVCVLKFEVVSVEARTATARITKGEVGSVQGLRAVLAASQVPPGDPLAPPPGATRATTTRPPAAPGAIPSRRSGAMSLVPGGTYPLGDAERRVAPFLMDAVEVTAAAYAGCVRVGRCDASGLDACGELGTYDPPGRRSHPINCVDWDQAAAFCAWAGKRLPTEEEWEWAARGAARGTRFPWGNGRPARQLCWDGPGNDAGEGGRIGTCRVGSYLAGNSPQGISDLAGNVWEWTADETGSTGERIVRGGGWGSGGPTLISANHRETHPGDHRDVAIGFRCVKNAE